MRVVQGVDLMVVYLVVPLVTPMVDCLAFQRAVKMEEQTDETMVDMKVVQMETQRAVLMVVKLVAS